MPRNASGVYSLPAGNPVVAGTTITASAFNLTADDIATALSDSLSRTGSGAMTVAFKMVDGSVATPGLTTEADQDTGWYYDSTGAWTFSSNGTQLLRLGVGGDVDYWDGSAWKDMRVLTQMEGYVANEHVDHSSVTISTGPHLTGGGDLTTNITISLDLASGRNIDHNSLQILAGTGLSGGGMLNASRALSLDTTNSRNVEHSSILINTGTALTGGGAINASRTISFTGVDTDGVGQTVFGAPLNTNTYGKGDTLSGTALAYCNADGEAQLVGGSVVLVPGVGTWRCAGHCTGTGLVTVPGRGATTNWIRIS